MQNGYFQLICDNNATALKVFPAKDGGTPVAIREIMEYLNRFGIKYDLHMLNQGITNSFGTEGEHVFTLNLDSNLELRESYSLAISPDKMHVYARFYPPSAGGERMSAGEFLGDLVHKSIRFGILEDEISSFFVNPQYCTNIKVAEGKPARHGTDAKIEYYFETDLNTKPTLKDDGSVDSYNLNTISHCKQGDVLARLFPEDPGEPGRSIYDENISPREVKQEKLNFGKNVVLSEDRLELTAAVNGHVTLLNGVVSVSNVLQVDNVDMSTGNIDYDGSVVVKGNVYANFSVKAKGNIEVSGVVEGAWMEAGGNIIIARGMNGMAKGILKAEGNVVAKFIENAKVRTGGYVSTESILHSEVVAGTDIQVTGKRGFITGGRVSAMDLIQVKTLGSVMGADTLVEVGATHETRLQMKKLQQQMMECKRVIESMQPVLNVMAQKLSQGTKFKPEQIKNIKEMIAADKKKKQELKDCARKLEELQIVLVKSEKARVEVTDRVYAGTRICVADAYMTVRDSMHYCRFIKSQGEVKTAPL